MATTDTVIQIEDLPRVAEARKPVSPEQLCTSNIPGEVLWTSVEKNVINFGLTPFYDCFTDAYSNHYPLRLSPDAIFLLILQGFAIHVYQNAEELRSKFVDFNNKKELVVDRRDLVFNQLTAKDFSEIFASFTDLIAENVGKELVENLTPNFTTTTPLSTTLCQLTLMTSFQKYFHYVAMVGGCGIPYIVLEGTPEDWESLLEKVKTIAKYDLEWWVSKLVPVLQEFVNAKRGHINKSFWMKFVRRKEGSGYYDPSVYNGHFTVFFPFTNTGYRTNLEKIYVDEKLANELLNCPLTLNIYFSETRQEPVPLNIISGFIGVSQDPETLEMKPEIGWFITDGKTTIKMPEIKFR